MTVLAKHLRHKAHVKVTQGMAIMLTSFLLGVYLGSIGLVVLLIGFFAASFFIYSGIGHIKCPSCNRPYGVGMSLIGSIEIPSKCICCHVSAK